METHFKLVWTNLVSERRYDRIAKHLAECRSRCNAVATEIRLDVENDTHARKKQKLEEGDLSQDPEGTLKLLQSYWECQYLKDMRQALLADYKEVLVSKKYKVRALILARSRVPCLISPKGQDGQNIQRGGNCGQGDEPLGDNGAAVPKEQPAAGGGAVPLHGQQGAGANDFCKHYLRCPWP